MATFQFQIGPDFDILRSLGDRIGLRAKGDKVVLPPGLGTGFIRQWTFPDGIRLFQFDFTLKHSLVFHTENPLEAGLFTLFINLSDSSMVSSMEVEDATMRRDLLSGIVFFHPSETTVNCPAGQRFRFLVAGFSKACIEPYLETRRPSALNKLLEPRKNFYLFEDIDLELERYLQLITLADDNDPLQKLAMHGHLLQFLHRLIHKLAGREENNNALVRQDELETLFQLRAFIKANLHKPITIPDIARRARFSESKLKKLFKQVFGKSVYQYVQYLRMLEAQRILRTGKYNLSETAALVGYANLTHFSAAFQKHLGMRPGDFLKRK